MDNLSKRLQFEAYVVGLKEVMRAIKAGNADVVYVATDADFAYKQRILEIANGVRLLSVATMQEMADAAKCEVPAAAIAILKKV